MVTEAVGNRTAGQMGLQWDQRSAGPELGHPPMGTSEPMARPVKSYSELQRQFIGAELGRREAVSREAALAAWHSAADDVATAPQLVKGLAAER